MNKIDYKNRFDLCCNILMPSVKLAAIKENDRFNYKI